MDDDGNRAAEISNADVSTWVAFSNRVYAAANVRFTFDPHDTSSFRSTLLNRMTGNTDPEWKREQKVANGLAASYPGKIVLLVRYGPGDQPTGGGFSWSDLDFIAMSRSRSSTPNVLAHEAGHYFGLAHTWNRSFKTVAEADAYVRQTGYRPQMFDGDGLSDTPATPLIEEISFALQAYVMLGGHRFDIQNDNIQSFYNYPDFRQNTLTPMQIRRVREVAALRRRNGMAHLDRVGWSNVSTVPTEKDNVFHVSDLDLAAVRQGFGKPQRDRTLDGKPLRFGGRDYRWGLGTHAPGEWIIRLARNGAYFESDVAVEDHSDEKVGSVTFRIFGDDQLLAESPVVRFNAVFKLRADVRGIERLRLVVTDAGDGIANDHATWLEPLVTLKDPSRAPSSAPN